MNRTRHSLALVLFLLAAPALADPQAAAAPAPAASKPAAPARPIADLAWLVDGVWGADATKLGPGLERIETRYRWSDNGGFIRFTTHFVTDQATLKRYDGNFWWDPDKKGLAMWYMNAENGVTQGPLTHDGDDFVMSFHGPDMAGQPADMQVHLTRKSPDLYHWALTEKVGDAWKPLLALDYARKSDS